MLCFSRKNDNWFRNSITVVLSHNLLCIKSFPQSSYKLTNQPQRSEKDSELISGRCSASSLDVPDPNKPL